ncbi:MAG: hypothetical protein OEZ08_19285 [Betaproteobacteria bacterium]|nr:hypothetical protein [Betaproteobacteria bacterium]
MGNANLAGRETVDRKIDMQWWGYSKEHGWVVLDRRVPSNIPGLNVEILFLRCRDATTFYATRESWNPPAYQFAPNYLRELSPPDSDEAAAELEALKARWPEFEREIQRVCQEEEKRAESARVEEEKARKEAAAEKKKQTAAAKT